MKNFLIAFITVVVISLIFGIGKLGSEKSSNWNVPRSVNVSGEFRAKVSPDIYVANFQIHLIEAEKELALQELEKKRTALYQLAAAENIDKKNISAQSVSANKQWKWIDGAQTEVGYSAVQSFSIEFQTPESATAFIRAAASIADLELTIIQPKIKDIQTKEKELLAKALQNALEKAEFLAEAAHTTCGKVLNISESNVHLTNDFSPFYEARAVNQQMPMRARLSKAEAAANGGGDDFAQKIEVSATIQVSVELK